VHATQARIHQRQLTGGIATDAVAAVRQGQLPADLIPPPELQVGLMGAQGAKGSADCSGPLAPGALQASACQSAPGLTVGRRKQGVEQRKGCQACAAARP
jgi:hypothetical protein